MKEKYFPLKLFLDYFPQIVDITLDPDPTWAKIQDPDPSLIFLDPQHCYDVVHIYGEKLLNIIKQSYILRRDDSFKKIAVVIYELFCSYFTQGKGCEWVDCWVGAEFNEPLGR